MDGGSVLHACKDWAPWISLSSCCFSHVLYLSYHSLLHLAYVAVGCAGQAGGRAKQVAVQEGLREFDAQLGPEVGGVPAQ